MYYGSYSYRSHKLCRDIFRKTQTWPFHSCIHFRIYQSPVNSATFPSYRCLSEVDQPFFTWTSNGAEALWLTTCQVVLSWVLCNMLQFGRWGPLTTMCEAPKQQYTGQASCCAHKKCHKPCSGAAVRPFGYRGKSSFKGSDSVENLFRQSKSSFCVAGWE
jgi:hypothetical protein